MKKPLGNNLRLRKWNNYNKIIINNSHKFKLKVLSINKLKKDKILKILKNSNNNKKKVKQIQIKKFKIRKKMRRYTLLNVYIIEKYYKLIIIIHFFYFQDILNRIRQSLNIGGGDEDDHKNSNINAFE